MLFIQLDKNERQGWKRPKRHTIIVAGAACVRDTLSRRLHDNQAAASSNRLAKSIMDRTPNQETGPGRKGLRKEHAEHVLHYRSTLKQPSS